MSGTREAANSAVSTAPAPPTTTGIENGRKRNAIHAAIASTVAIPATTAGPLSDNGLRSGRTGGSSIAMTVITVVTRSTRPTATYPITRPVLVSWNTARVAVTAARPTTAPSAFIMPSRPEARPRSSAGTTSGITAAYAPPARLKASWTSMYANASVSWLPANASRPSPARFTAVPATSHGRRLPHRVEVRSLNQPARIGAIRANRLPAELTRPIRRSAELPAITNAATGTSWNVIGGQWAPCPSHIALIAINRPVPRRLGPFGGSLSKVGAAAMALKLECKRRGSRRRPGPGWQDREPRLRRRRIWRS